MQDGYSLQYSHHLAPSAVQAPLLPLTPKPIFQYGIFNIPEAPDYGPSGQNPLDKFSFMAGGPYMSGNMPPPLREYCNPQPGLNWDPPKNGLISSEDSIKCSKERPTCKNCIKSKKNCEGYTQRVIFKHPVGKASSDLTMSTSTKRHRKPSTITPSTLAENGSSRSSGNVPDISDLSELDIPPYPSYREHGDLSESSILTKDSGYEAEDQGSQYWNI
jgi:Fungal Zn(2)-Cys(6) binuclear cluster domain